MVTYKQIQPSRQLDKYIACYVLIESGSTNLFYKDFHIVPSANSQLVVIYEDNYIDSFVNSKLPDNPLIGPLTKYRIFTALGKVGIFIVVFKPLGISLLLKDSLINLKENYVSSDLLPQFIKTLKNKLLEARETKDRLNVANQMLYDYFSRVDFSKVKIPIDEIDKYIVKNKGAININQLASYFNCSISKLERNFKELVGLTPKSYAKLIRLRNAVRLTAKTDDLIDIMFSLGYYDQAHFIKEFKSYVGESPLKFRCSDKNYTKEFFKNNKSERIVM